MVKIAMSEIIVNKLYYQYLFKIGKYINNIYSYKYINYIFI